MSNNPKDDDWGMTMPNARLDEEIKKDLPPSFPPKSEQAPSLPPDDWGMTTPNVNIPQNALPPTNQASSQPFSDFDQTAPNLNIPPQYTDQPKPPAPPASAGDDWGVTDANINIPKESKKDDWQMPAPKFRVSEGAKPNFDKTTPNFNLKDLNNDFGDAPYGSEEIGDKTTPYYRLPENQAESNAPAAAAPIVEEAAESAPPAAPAPKSGNMKWVLLLGGLFAFFMLVTAGLVGVYFLYFDTSNTVKSTANKPVETAPTPAPTAAPVATSLPATVNYKGDMVLVAAGEFTMGADAGGDESKPAHKATVPAFYIDKTEVTNAQYKEFCNATGKTPPPDPFWEKGYFENRPDAPVLGVSFDDAKAFAAWAGKRLPTEIEWEKAASWDAAAQAKRDFPWGASFESGKAAFGLDTPKDVGSYPSGASPSGALDMAGNVAEWVDAFFQPYPGNTTENSNFGEINRVVRGGHFGSKTNDLLKTTKRIYVPPGVASGEDEEKLFAAAIGFRCAVSADDARLQEALGK
ncbi:MAG TPA: SUMF1/EgtB/PvdO family nonheme iron enzyme [Pyrinomonadaceae bacterium]